MRVRLAMVPGSRGHGGSGCRPTASTRGPPACSALLCLISVGAGYVGTLLTQTMTYAADEFGADRQRAGDVLAAVRVGVLLAVVVTARADRAGRRRLLGIAAMGAALLTLTGAAAPTLGVAGHQPGHGPRAARPPSACWSASWRPRRCRATRVPTP